MKIICILVAIVLTANLFARDIHVSFDATVTGDGSSSKPYKTIQEAANVAVAGDIILIHKGTYRETVTPLNSGTAGNRIVFQSFMNDTVVIDGSDVITNWVPHSANIYRAAMSWDLGAENQVFINGTMGQLARWPNVANEADPFFDFNSYARCDAGSTKNNIIDNSLPSKPDNFYKDCILWGNFGVKWTAFGTRILSSTGNQLSYSGGDTYHAPFPKLWGKVLPTDFEMYFLSGKYELLDTANEWYYDSVKDSMYIMLMNASDTNLEVKAKRRLLAFNLDGKNYITIKNVNVFAATITMNDSKYCVINGINAKYLTHHSFDGVNPYNLSGNLKDRCGISISGVCDSVINCAIKYSVGSGITIGHGSNHVVDNNDIQYCNYLNSYCEGVSSREPDGDYVFITRNKIWYTGGPLIDFGKIQPNNFGNIIMYNDCAYGEQLGDDRGGINGSCGEVAYNWVHNIGHGLAFDVTNGLYTDQSGDYVTYHHNVIWGQYNPANPPIRINNTAGNLNGNQEIYIYNNKYLMII